ncbi:MAG: hypothetical protein RBU36_15210 [Thermoanaerobaculia bacterium]|nr:hypothetical protein [Thermoanaerobaculia bacterium]
MNEWRSDDTFGARDVDARLSSALRDDVPPEVARRLERRAAAEVARRRIRRPFLLALLDRLVPAPALTRLAIPAGLVLLASGALLQGSAWPSEAREALQRLNVTASASRALGEAGPLLCGAGSPLEGLGPEALSDRAFRSWLLVGTEEVPEGRLRLVFRAPRERARYEVVVDAASFRPRTIRRTRLDAPPGGVPVSDECAWPGNDGRPVPERRSR